MLRCNVENCTCVVVSESYALPCALVPYMQANTYVTFLRMVYCISVDRF